MKKLIVLILQIGLFSLIIQNAESALKTKQKVDNEKSKETKSTHTLKKVQKVQISQWYWIDEDEDRVWELMEKHKGQDWLAPDIALRKK